MARGRGGASSEVAPGWAPRRGELADVVVYRELKRRGGILSKACVTPGAPAARARDNPTRPRCPTRVGCEQKECAPRDTTTCVPAAAARSCPSAAVDSEPPAHERGR